MPKAYVRAITEVKTFGKKKEEAKEKAIDSDTRISPFGANITVVKNMEIKIDRNWIDRDTAKQIGVCTFILIVATAVLFLKNNNVLAAPSDSFDVSFLVSSESPSHVCIDDYITNLQDSNDDFPYKAVLNETTVDLSKLTVKFYEWKAYDVQVADYSTECNPYNTTNETLIDNCTRVVSGSHIETRWRWLERNLIDSTEDGSTLRNQWEEVQIKKAETKKFRRCYYFNEIPKHPSGGWGSVGYTYLDVKGADYYDFTESSWWDSNYGYRLNVTMTIQDETIDYEDYFLNISMDLLSLVSAGKMENNFKDLRIVDGTATSLDYKVIQPADGSNASIWLNYTNGTGDLQIYYGFSSAVQPTDHNFTHWVHYGTSFDDMEVGALPDDGDWAIRATYTGGITSADYFYGGSPTGNKSLIVDDNGDRFGLTIPSNGMFTHGKIQFTYSSPDNADLFFSPGECFDECNDLRIRLAGTIIYVDNEVTEFGGGSRTLGSNYTFEIDVDTESDEYNVTIQNETGLWTVNNIDIFGDIDNITAIAITSYANQLSYFDNIIMRDTNGVYKDPLHSSGEEETPPVVEDGAQYSNNFSQSATPQTYTEGKDDYGFQIDWDINIDNVTFESDFDGANKNYTTPSNISTDTWWINFTQDENMTVGTHSYKWYAANSTGENMTEAVGFIVNINTTTSIDMLLNNTLNADYADDWPAIINVTCDINRDTENTFTMVRNGTVLDMQVGSAIEYIDDISAGGYNFMCNYTEHNYSSYVREQFFTLSGAAADITLLINGTAASRTMLNSTFINITAVTGYATETISLVTNLTGWERVEGVGSVENTSVWNTTAKNTYNITANISTANFTGSSVTYYLTLDNVSVREESFNSQLVVGQSNTMTITFELPQGIESEVEDLTAELTWDGTIYANDSFSISTVGATTFYTLGKTLTVPVISVAKNITFFWNYSYNNKEENITTAFHNQSLDRPVLSICNSTINTMSMIIEFRNETDDFTMINASADLVLLFYTDTTSFPYNFSVVNETIHICILPSWANFSVDGHVQYSNNSYQTRDYWFDNEVFDNTTEELDMLLIPTELAPKLVRFTVNDQYGAPYPDIIIKPQRWYPGLNKYKTVASLKANEQGQANTYLVLNIIYYRFLLQVDGETITTIPARLIPDDGSTLIDIEMSVDPQELLDYIRYYNKITGTCSYANVTGNITCSYTDSTADGLLASVDFKVKEYAGALATSTVCSQTNTTMPSGSFICHIGNESAYTNTYNYNMIGTISTGETLLIYSNVLDKKEGVSKLFGDCSSVANLGKCREGAVIAFMLTLIAALIGTYSPSVGIMLSLSGVVLTGAMGLWAMSALVSIGLFFLAAIFIYMSR